MGDFVPTRVSKLKATAQEDFLVINHETKKKVKKHIDDAVRSADALRKLTASTWGRKTRSHPPPEKKDATDERTKQEREMKRTRYEVMKFAMAGFDKLGAHQAKEALAVSLGAKPPKNKRENYKILKQQRAERKSKENAEARVSGLSKSMLGGKPKRKSSQQRDRAKSKDGILGTYGKVDSKVIRKVKH